MAAESKSKAKKKNSKKAPLTSTPLPGPSKYNKGGIRCDFCNKTVGAESNLEAHFSACHELSKMLLLPDVQAALVTIDGDSKFDTKSPKPPPEFQCPKCSKPFRHQGKALEKHVQKCQNGKKVVADKTKKGGKTAAKPKSKPKKRRRIVARVSGVATPTASPTPSRKQDKTVHCEMCGKNYSQIGSLQRHINVVHLGLKPFNCESCKLDFTQMSHLKKHQRSKKCLNATASLAGNKKAKTAKQKKSGDNHDVQELNQDLDAQVKMEALGEVKDAPINEHGRQTNNVKEEQEIDNNNPQPKTGQSLRFDSFLVC